MCKHVKKEETKVRTAANRVKALMRVAREPMTILDELHINKRISKSENDKIVFEKFNVLLDFPAGNQLIKIQQETWTSVPKNKSSKKEP